MHLMIPFASVLSEAGQQALETLALPRLDQLLARLVAAECDAGDEYSLSPPHERALARAIGLAGGDGTIPWAACAAARDGIDTGDLAWALLTPVHWQLAADHVNLLDPSALALDETESRALLEALREIFESEGYALAYGAPLRWYVAHESLADLPCASLDRVIGRDVDLWLTDDARVQRVRRLQNEVQMLLYTHPINERREARGALPVNSFWLSGCGVRQQATYPRDLRVDDRLRAPALAGDWAAWAEAWHTLDADTLRDALGLLSDREPLTLTLCGERNAQRFESQPTALWSRIARRLRSSQPRFVLGTL
jgi:hypothetical protein